MDGDFPPNVVELIQRQLSQFGRVGATKLYRWPDLPTPIPVNGSGGPIGTLSNPLNIRFREPGTVIALYGQTQLATVASFALTAARIQIGGQEDITTNGNQGDFATFLSLFGATSNWFPLWRRAIPGVDWTITYRNDDTANTSFPNAFLAFIADADLARQAGGPPQG